MITDEMGNVVAQTCHQGTIALHEVNIPEHGTHDRHLVRINDDLALAFGLMKQEERAQSYLEEAEDAHTP
jgi:hypothetical protein